MRFRLIGPMELTTAGQTVEIGPPQRRAVVAALLAEAGEVVPLETLVGRVWDQAPPLAARDALYAHITRIRRLLEQAGQGSPLVRLVRSSGGYALKVQPDMVDLHRFRGLVEQARSECGKPDQQAAVLGEALQLWRGRPLADIPGRWAADLRRSTEQQLVGVAADWAQAQLRLGHEPLVIDKLASLVAGYPLAEPLVESLMLALCAAGRDAEALECFARTRKQLADKLGAEPGPPLRELHEAILRGEIERAAPAALTVAERPAPIPRQLPPHIPGFVGRATELDLLHQALLRTDQRRPAPVLNIIGIGGIGKSALAIQAAHQVATGFPDGNLYVDLHGATAGLRPAEPVDVLGGFLRALGVGGGDIPEQVDEAAACFRSRTAERRILVVLDNAADEAQVRPLLPGTSTGRVLATSRQPVTGLDGVRQLHLDSLTPREAVELLGQQVGFDRVAAEPEATAELARSCGYLPLALRIAAARLAARPRWPVAALAERIGDTRRRLDELQLGEAGVRTSFSVSYQQLSTSSIAIDQAAARAFALLGAWDGPEIGIPAGAMLLDEPELTTEHVLERLVDSRLAHTSSPGRYRLHDLLRLYAREQATALLPEPERITAVGRVLRFYVATVWHTLELLRPGDHRLTAATAYDRSGGLRFARAAEALEWLDTERAALLTAVHQAAANRATAAAAVQLAQALFGYFLHRHYWRDCEQVNRAALTHARHVDDRVSQAQAANDLGVARSLAGHFDEAIARFRESLAIWRETGDRTREAGCLGNLGNAYARLGRYELALACQQEAVAIHADLGYRRGHANALSGLGTAYSRVGRHDEALRCLRQSLAIYQELADRRAQAVNLGNLGGVCELLGSLEAAIRYLQRSLVIHRELGSQGDQLVCLVSLGTVHTRNGHYVEAQTCLTESLAIARDLGELPRQAESLHHLGVAVRALGCDQQARDYWQQALAIYEHLKLSEADEVRALLGS